VILFYLDKKYADEMVAQARAEAPDECCGILAGVNGRVIKLYHTANSEHSPDRYSIDPKELIAIYKEIQENSWGLLAVYHSHTHTEAYPSPTDIHSAVLPEALYIIISLSNPGQVVIRGFNISQGKVSEVELKNDEAPGITASNKIKY
jgi:proteasome lid subunit RPN8/RPN11